MGEQFDGTLNRDGENRLTSAEYKDEKWVSNIEMHGSDIRRLRDEISIGAGDVEMINVETEKPFRIFVRKHTDPENAWMVYIRAEVMGMAVGSSGSETVLQSNGTNVTIGKGSRATAYTDVMTPVGDRTNFYIVNEGSQSSTFSFYLIEYPIGSSGVQNAPASPTNVHGNRGFYIDDISALAPGGEKTIVEIGAYSELVYLEFVTDSETGGQLRLQFRTSENAYQTIGQLSPSRMEPTAFRPFHLLESGIWSINKYEPEQYKFTLRKDFIFPAGFRIQLVNRDDENEITIGCRGYGVTVDV